MASNMETSVVHRLKSWGENSVTPAATATFMFAQPARPFQRLPMLFPPLLLLSSYMNVRGYKKDAAGTSAAWSGLYLVLALRRSQALRNKLTVRGAVRGLTLGLCAMNMVGGGLAYAFGNREDEDHT